MKIRIVVLIAGVFCTGFFLKGGLVQAEDLILPWTVESIQQALTTGTILVYARNGTDADGEIVADYFRYEITETKEDGLSWSGHAFDPADPTETLPSGGSGWKTWPEPEAALSPFFLPMDPEITLLRNEQITVPAGTFTCMVLEITGFMSDPVTVWLSPDLPGVYAKVVEGDVVLEFAGIRKASPTLESPEALLQTVDALTATLAQQPQDAEAYYQRGAAYLKSGQYAEAIQDYTKVIELIPQAARGYQARGLAYTEFAYPDKAIADYQQAVERDPTDAVTYQYWGRTLAQTQQFEEALQKFQKAIELDPDDARTYFERGYAYMQANKFAQAIYDYTECLRRQPDNFRAWYYRGAVYAKLQQDAGYLELEWDDNAIHDYFQAVRFKNAGKYGKPAELEMVAYELATLYQKRGKLAYEAKQYTAARRDFTSALEYDTDDAATYYWRAQSYRQLGKYPEAIQDYDAALAHDPKLADAYYYRGLTYQWDEQYAQAIPDYTTYIELDPQESATYKLRGDCLRLLERYAEAIQDYQAAIERESEYATAYYGRGLAYEQSGQNESAARDYNIYLKLQGEKDKNADKIRQKIRDLGYTPEF